MESLSVHAPLVHHSTHKSLYQSVVFPIHSCRCQSHTHIKILLRQYFRYELKIVGPLCIQMPVICFSENLNCLTYPFLTSPQLISHRHHAEGRMIAKSLQHT